MNEYVVKKKSLDDSIIGILIIDPDGRVVAATDEGELGADESGDEYFVKGKSHPFVGSLAGEEHLEVNEELVASAPLIDADTGELLGVIVNIFDGSRLSASLSGRFRFMGGALSGTQRGSSDTLESYVVNRDKKIFIHPEPGYSRRHAGAIVSDTLPVQKCLENNEETIAVYMNYEGEEVLGASMCLVDKGWTLLAEVQAREAFKPIRDSYILLVVATSGLALLIILSSLIFTRFITGPLNELSAAVDDISKGDFKRDIPGGSFINEVISLQESLRRIVVSMKLAISKTKSISVRNLAIPEDSKTEAVKKVKKVKKKPRRR